MRRCTKCKQRKEIAAFYTKGTWCKVCLREYGKKYYVDRIKDPAYVAKRNDSWLKNAWNRRIKKLGRIHEICLSCTCTVKEANEKDV